MLQNITHTHALARTRARKHTHSARLPPWTTRLSPISGVPNDQNSESSFAAHLQLGSGYAQHPPGRIPRLSRRRERGASTSREDPEGEQLVPMRGGRQNSILWARRQLRHGLGSPDTIPSRRWGTTISLLTVQRRPRGFAFKNRAGEGSSERTCRALHSSWGPFADRTEHTPPRKRVRGWSDASDRSPRGGALEFPETLS